MSSQPRSLQKDLQVTMLITGMIAAIGIGLIGWTGYRFQEESAKREQLIASAQSARNSVVKLERDLETMTDKFARFKRFQDENIVGEFPKTLALDHFESVLGETRVPLLNYSLAGRLKLDLPDISGFADYEPGHHEFRFETSPLHEERLILLTEEIDRLIGGLHALEGCSLTRDDERGMESSMSNRVARLTARCTMSWFVFAKRAAQQGAAAAPAGF
ncbi:MAG: hypothetical protein R3E83_09980 [Burkholderiaceae bacterium]